MHTWIDIIEMTKCVDVPKSVSLQKVFSKFRRSFHEGGKEKKEYSKQIILFVNWSACWDPNKESSNYKINH